MNARSKDSRRRALLQLAGSCAFAMATAVLPLEGKAETPVPKRFELKIEERRVEVPGNVLRVDEGDQVEFSWTSDETGMLHLHGYNIEMPVSPDAPAVFTFDAHTAGRFPVTSHGFAGEGEDGGHSALFYFEVYPR